MSMGSILTSVRDAFPPMNEAGYPFVGGAVLLAFVMGLFSGGLSLFFLLAAACCYLFFRDPVRMVPVSDDLVIAPADGLITAVIPNASLPPELAAHDTGADYTKISIFLSVLDVHVNRVPASGRVVEVAYNPGKFLNASLDKASEENERSAALIERSDGRKLVVVQIAGLIARRIINTMRPDQRVTAGERYGLIRFGSRTDVYVPAGSTVLALRGQRAVGGETVLADLSAGGPARAGTPI